jgi:hypothetical protein
MLKMNVTIACTRDYKNVRLRTRAKNKANQTPRICRNRRIKLTKTHQFAIISSDLTFFSFILLPFAALLAENCLFLQEPYTTVVV